MNLFAKNIKFLRRRRKRTQEDVALSLNMKRSTLSGYENEVAEPGIEALIAFAKYFNMAMDTLIMVDLSTLGESQLGQLERGGDVFISGSNVRILATTVDKNNDDNIELVPEKAQAGYKRGHADPQYIRELQVFNLPFLSKNKKYRTFQIKGDSMLPIPDKSWVTGEYIQDWRTIGTGQACIILTMNEGIMFKIVENLLDKEKRLRLYSLNSIYKPYEISANEIQEIWKFVHYISHEIPDPLLPREELFETVNQVKKNVEILSGMVAKSIGK